MADKIEIARTALKASIKVRRQLDEPIDTPVNPIEMAEKLKIEVRYIALPSLEGMFSITKNAIILSSMRPIGRRASTCAHEIGHWYFGHGDRIDEYGSFDHDCSESQEEMLANRFASYLLMPKKAISGYLNSASISPENITAEQAFSLSTVMGIGYTTLLNHMCWSLNFITSTKLRSLLAFQPKKIKSTLLGFEFSDNLVDLRVFRPVLPIDLEVGDKLIVPGDCKLEGASVSFNDEYRTIVNCVIPGIAIAQSESMGWSIFIRVSKKEFVGRAIYRHMEDDND